MAHSIQNASSHEKFCHHKWRHDHSEFNVNDVQSMQHQLPKVLSFWTKILLIDSNSSGYFPGVWLLLKADVSEPCIGSIFNRWWSMNEDWESSRWMTTNQNRYNEHWPQLHILKIPQRATNRPPKHTYRTPRPLMVDLAGCWPNII